MRMGWRKRTTKTRRIIVVTNNCQLCWRTTLEREEGTQLRHGCKLGVGSHQ